MAAIVLYGLTIAWSRAWTCDDAFISFRYADNLVRGFGLVFNAHERVEGYTNFLWTLWVALGLRLGVTAETWALVSGIACYGASAALLCVLHSRLSPGTRHAAFLLPVAVLGAVLHRDWTIYATGGLETALFTFLLLAGFTLLTAPEHPRVGAGALTLGLATLTRPDGALAVVVALVYVATTRPPRLRNSLVFAATALAVSLPHAVWRLWYYGDFVPNTYYAKSAQVAWYGQGLIYLGSYLAKYWALLVGIVTLPRALRWWRRRDHATYTHLARSAGLAAGLVLVYTWYVVRVGGDFMFARLLIPTVPFVLILLEIALSPLAVTNPTAHAVIAAATFGAMLMSPVIVTDTIWLAGIADEWRVYSAARTNEGDRQGATLKPFFKDLPVSIAFLGGEARLVYQSRVAVAIESEAGLTDRHAATQPLARRGRIGHEKRASASYLIDERQVHFAFHPEAATVLQLDTFVPEIAITMGGVRGRVLHWDPELMARLRERGAVFNDFPAALDEYIAQIDTLPDEAVRAAFNRYKRFYFNYVHDPDRESRFRMRIEAGSSWSNEQHCAERANHPRDH
jgi:arabinofuranosyltransferase